MALIKPDDQLDANLLEFAKILLQSDISIPVKEAVLKELFLPVTISVLQDKPQRFPVDNHSIVKKQRPEKNQMENALLTSKDKCPVCHREFKNTTGLRKHWYAIESGLSNMHDEFV